MNRTERTRSSRKQPVKMTQRHLYRIVQELSSVRINRDAAIKEKNGVILLKLEEKNKRWIEHFKDTLNQSASESLFDLETEAAQRDLQATMDKITEEESTKAVKALESNKVVRLDQTAELLKSGDKMSQKC